MARDPRFRALGALAAVLWLLAPGLAGAATAAPPATTSLPPTPLAFTNASAFAGVEYLIVTASPYAAAMQSIADWKTQKGLPAKVALFEDINFSYSGRDGAQRLHNFLQDVYFNGTGEALKYVLLGGGSAVLPTRYLRTDGSNTTDYTNDLVLSDIYYAGLDTDWDRNGDGVFGEYGEEDWDANVFVGRLPFNSVAEAGFARDNLLSYEKAPFVGPWMRSAVAFASVMDPPNNEAPPFNYDPTEDNALRSVQLALPHVPSGMSVDVLADYYEFPALNYTPAQDRLSSASMVGAISAGNSVVMSVTHGWVPSGRGVPQYAGSGADYTWSNGLVYQNASNFTNFGQLSFGYFSSCIVGNFADPSLPTLARFVVQDNHGFIAEIVPTDGTLRGEDAFSTYGLREGNWWQSENFWRNFFTGTDPFRAGPALYQGIRDYGQHVRDSVWIVGANESWGRYRTQKAVYNLLGDPEVPIWTDVAATFNASWPSTLYTAESHFRATLKDSLGRPASGATVALQGPGVYAVATADAQGRVDMLVQPTSTGSLRATATLHNFIPLQVSIPIATAPPDLSISAANVTLSRPILKSGEAVQVNFTVRNVGQLPSNSTDARAFEELPSGPQRLIASSVALPALGAGEETTTSFTWTATEDGNHILHIVVDPTDSVAEFDELNNEVAIEVGASSVDLALLSGSVSINPPGQVSPGGIVTASGTVERTGLVPRGYLIGYELVRTSGATAASGNVVASATTASFSFEVPVAVAGEYELRIRADAADEILEFDELNNGVAFAVRAGAGPSFFALPPVRLQEDAPPTAVLPDLRAFVSDPDTPFSQLEVTASASAPELEVWVDGYALFARPRAEWSGAGTIALAAADDQAQSTALTPFTVDAQPDAPWIEGPSVGSVEVGGVFDHRVVAGDLDGGALSFSLLSSGPPATGAIAVDSEGLIAFVATEGMVGSFTLAVTVTDSSARTASTRITVVVLPADRAPELADLGRLVVTRGAGASFQLVANDADGDPVAFSSNDGRATVSPSGLLELTPSQVAALPAGTTTVRVSVSDGLKSTTGNVTLEVVERAPARGQAWAAENGPWVIGALAVAVAAAGCAVALRKRRPS